VPPDLDPAAVSLVNVLAGVHAEDLARPTPCVGWTVGHLLSHVDGLTRAFAAAADKDPGPLTAGPPPPPDPQPEPGWTTRIPRQVEALVRAWHQPEAWSGPTRVGGVDLPGEVAGVVGLTELVLHGWDLARATGQLYEADESSVRLVLEHVERVGDDREELFGPPLPVPDGADPLDRALRLAGRDPDWLPAPTD
jgi:uncharacterized protein (TIGR03086 family)